MDEIRVIRILEYVGPRNCVEEILMKSIHGAKVIERYSSAEGTYGRVTISASTLGLYPEIMKRGDEDV